LFTDRKIVNEKRKTSILKDCIRKDTFFICHKETASGGKPIEGISPGDLGLCCRGFFDKFNTRPIGMAKALQIVQFVDVK
jgi:hypothetical protein